LANSFPDFFGSLNSEWKADDGTLISALKVSNSVWVDKSLTVKQNCLDLLANSFYCSSYLADFAGNNQGANQAIRSFVKKQTNNLIDKNFDLSTDTVFSLINTLYLKDIWALNDTLNETSETYTFTNHDGSEKTLKLLQGYYLDGRAYEAEQYSTFYTTTLSGYKLKFILPAEGFTISDVFTQENIATVNALTDYHSTDDQQKIRYVTRCLFPSFEASYDNNITKILQNDFAIRDLFDKNRCNLLAFCDVPSQYDNIFCSKIQHVTKLTVDKKGIEGAAVTVESLDGVGAPLEEYTTTYLDFLLNKAFGFILTDRHNVTLFSGVVNTI
jgi:serine protease inhibitor